MCEIVNAINSSKLLMDQDTSLSFPQNIFFHPHQIDTEPSHTTNRCNNGYFIRVTQLLFG